MNYKNYKKHKDGDYISVGTLEGIYVCEILTGFCDTPEYHSITEDEFNTFEDWMNDEIKIIRDIKNREVLCSGYLDK